MGKHAQSIDSRILQRAKAGKDGRVFTARDFLDLGSRDAVDKALSRQSRDGSLRKIARGLYDIPRQDAQLGQLAPSVDAISKAHLGYVAAINSNKVDIWLATLGDDVVYLVPNQPALDTNAEMVCHREGGGFAPELSWAHITPR